MEKVQIYFSWIDSERDKELTLPAYETEQASGMDVAAAVSKPLILEPGARGLVPTGFAVAIPHGYEIQVRPRSGLAVKFGITVINAPGTVDADYRGEVKVALVNLSDKQFTVHRGDRIAQLVLAPVCQAKLEIVTALDRTKRNDGGFGHTGVR